MQSNLEIEKWQSVFFGSLESFRVCTGEEKERVGGS